MFSRPLSPHLQVYRLPLAAVISITHRILGGVFFAASFVVSLYCLMTMAGFDLIWLDYLLFSSIVKIKLSFFAAAMSFYILAEIRYIVWNLNWGFYPTFINVSNVLIITFSFLAGVVCFVIIWR